MHLFHCLLLFTSCYFSLFLVRKKNSSATVDEEFNFHGNFGTNGKRTPASFASWNDKQGIVLYPVTIEGV